MTNAQYLALAHHYFDRGQSLREVKWNPAESSRLYVKYYDSGGNLHYVSYAPNGLQRTHEV